MTEQELVEIERIICGKYEDDVCLIDNTWCNGLCGVPKAREVYKIICKKADEARNEIAKKIFHDIFRIIFIQYVDEMGERDKYIDSDLFVKDLRELAKKYGVEEEE